MAATSGLLAGTAFDQIAITGSLNLTGSGSTQVSGVVSSNPADGRGVDLPPADHARVGGELDEDPVAPAPARRAWPSQY